MSNQFLPPWPEFPNTPLQTVTRISQLLGLGIVKRPSPIFQRFFPWALDVRGDRPPRSRALQKISVRPPQPRVLSRHHYQKCNSPFTVINDWWEGPSSLLSLPFSLSLWFQHTLTSSFCIVIALFRNLLCIIGILLAKCIVLSLLLFEFQSELLLQSHHVVTLDVISSPIDLLLWSFIRH